MLHSQDGENDIVWDALALNVFAIVDVKTFRLDHAKNAE